MPTRSPGFSIAGPDVARTGTPISLRDHVGERRLAETGRAVQQHVIERLAALLARPRSTTCRFSRMRSWPMYSSSTRGRRPASYCASSSTRAAVTRRSSVTWPVPATPVSTRARSWRRMPIRGLDRGFNGFLGERPMIPQVHERRDHVVAQRRRLRTRRAPAAAAAVGARGSRSFSSSTMRSDVFLPTPGIAVSRATSPRSIARIELGRLDAGQHRQRQLRTDAADADQPLEQLLLEQRREAVEQRAHPRARACGCAARSRVPGSPRP